MDTSAVGPAQPDRDGVDVFISYRRTDSLHSAERIYKNLGARLGYDNVFFDIARRDPGLNFANFVMQRAGRCDALVAVIGRHWLWGANESGRRYLDNRDDSVRAEIETALGRNIPVMPVLVDGAAMPSESDLPERLKPLARRQALEIRQTHFDSDIERLVRDLSHILELRKAETVAQSGGSQKLEAPPLLGEGVQA